MHISQSGWSDQRIEVLIGDLLRVGVVLAAVVSLIGGVVYLAHAGNTRPEYKVFHGEPADLRDVRGVVSNAFSGNGSGIIQLGLLLLDSHSDRESCIFWLRVCDSAGQAVCSR